MPTEIERFYKRAVVNFLQFLRRHADIVPRFAQFSYAAAPSFARQKHALCPQLFVKGQEFCKAADIRAAVDLVRKETGQVDRLGLRRRDGQTLVEGRKYEHVRRPIPRQGIAGRNKPHAFSDAERFGKRQKVRLFGAAARKYERRLVQALFMLFGRTIVSAQPCKGAEQKGKVFLTDESPDEQKGIAVKVQLFAQRRPLCGGKGLKPFKVDRVREQDGFARPLAVQAFCGERPAGKQYVCGFCRKRAQGRLDREMVECLSKALCAWQMRTGMPALFAGGSANAERTLMCECTAA